MKNKLTYLLSLFMILLTTSVFADNLCKDLEKRGDDLFRIKGFLLNAGQVGDEFGAPRNDVKYIFEKGNFKLLLKTNGYSYELSHTENLITETEMVNYKALPKYARYKPDIKVISHRVDVEFLNSNPNPEIIHTGQSEDYFNYYTQYTPKRGVEDVRAYNNVKYIDIYTGIDLEFKSTATGIKYDIIVKPGANINEIRMKYSGADNLELLNSGRIKILTSEGYIEESIPASFLSTYQGTSDFTASSDVKYLLEDNTIKFKVSNYDKQLYLTIDPEIVWGTYYGDIYYDAINAIQNDELNNVIASGYTLSKTNIATSGTYQTTYGGGGFDAFIVKISHSGQRLWGTYNGGDSLDIASGVAADNVWHHVYIMGYTASRNGLVSEGCYQENYGGGYFDSFIGKFDMTGHRLWCTYFGGSDAHDNIGGEYLFNAATDERFNEVYIVGVVSSRDSIASNFAHQTMYMGNFDAVLAKFKDDGVRDWATYYGGKEFDGAYGITLDPSGYITIGGYTESVNNEGIEFEELIATEGAYQFALSGNPDGFIARFNLRGTRQWGTYFGGPNEEIVNCTAADKDKNIYIGGSTGSSTGISSSGSHQSTFSGLKDGFIAKFSSTGTRLWSTYYGGLRFDEVSGMYCDSQGYLYMTGQTQSKENISTPGSFQPIFIGKDSIFMQDGPKGPTEVHILMNDGFIASMNPDGTRRWGTYFGGWEDETPKAVAVDLNDNFLIGGFTQTTALLTTPGTFKPTYSDTTDGFIMKFGEFVRLTDITTPFCVGNPITITYETGTEMNSGNVFTAQLSDSTGDFSNPIDIGTKTATKAGTIDATIPKNTPPGEGYRIRIVSSNPAKISKDNEYDITVSPLPVPVIQGDSPACSREEKLYFATDQENVTNLWYVFNGKIIGDSSHQSVNIVWDDVNQGRIKVVQTNNVTGCIDSIEKVVSVNITPLPMIKGESEVLSYSTHSYSSNNQSNWQYLWSVTGGTINSSNTTNNIEVTWGGVGVGTVKLVNTHKTSHCHDSLVFNVAINSAPIKINGKKTVCAESIEEYSISPETDLTYQWITIGGEIQGIDNDTIMSVQWGKSGNGVIKLIRTNNQNQEIDTVSMNVTIIELPATNILGIDENCEGDVELYYTTNIKDVTNEWSVYNGTLSGDIANDSISVNWNRIPEGNDSVAVVASITLSQTSTVTGCTKIKTKYINLSSRPSIAFVGSGEVCENDISFYFNRTPEQLLLNKWFVKGGTIIGDNDKDTLQVNWGPQGTGSIKLVQRAITNCDDSLEMSIAIVDNPEKPSITQAGTKLVSSADFANQWYKNGEVMIGATEKEYEPDSSGLYSVKVIVSSGCESQMSTPFNYVKISVNDFIPKDDFIVYPNPTNGKIRLEINSEIRTNEFTILDLLGKEMMRFDFGNNEKVSDLDISMLTTGIYIIQFKIGNEIKNIRIIKY